MSDWNALLQARLEADAKEAADRAWQETLIAIRERDLPVISTVPLACIPTWQDDVLPRFRRWAVVADLYHFGEWARKAYLTDWT